MHKPPSPGGPVVFCRVVIPLATGSRYLKAPETCLTLSFTFILLWKHSLLLLLKHSHFALIFLRKPLWHAWYFLLLLLNANAADTFAETAYQTLDPVLCPRNGIRGH